MGNAPDHERPDTLPAAAGQAILHARAQRLRDSLRPYHGVMLFIVLPILLISLYYAFIAADLYASEAKFVVRNPSRMQISPLSNLLQGSGLARTQDDIYSVKDYVVSRDAIAALEKRMPLREMFARPEADFLARFPGLLYDGSAEDFYKYYQSRVEVIHDSTTGITSVTVKAFRARDAKKIADALLQESEALVNRLNERARRNAVTDAVTDVEIARGHVLGAQQNMLHYRRRESMLDPAKNSAALLDTLSKLKSELTTTQTRLADLSRSSPDSPLKGVLQGRISALQRQINEEQTKLAGGNSALAPKIPEYEQLALTQDLATKELASAMASLELARAESRRQQIYLDRVVEPSLPDKAEYPRRLRGIGISLLSLLLAYWIGRLLLAGIREHSQV